MREPNGHCFTTAHKHNSILDNGTDDYETTLLYFRISVSCIASQNPLPTGRNALPNWYSGRGLVHTEREQLEFHILSYCLQQQAVYSVVSYTSCCVIFALNCCSMHN